MSMSSELSEAGSSRAADRALRMAGVAGLLLWGALLWVTPRDASAGKEQQILAGHELQTLSGENARLPEAGAVHVVHFWASWCAPCRKELPLLDEMQGRYAEQGVRFAAISVDTDPARLVRFLEEVPVSLPVYIDGPAGIARALDLPSLPYTVVLDASGNTVLSTAQSGPSAMKAISQSLDRTLAQAASESQQAN
jgi:thiol-disulfide isomerase/thioredoxin